MLSIQDLNCYYGNVQVLKNVNLCLQSGEILGLLGRNGAGKTTLLKSIMGLVKPRSGTIKLDETDLTQCDAHDVPKLGLAYVPQGRRLFAGLSVEENLQMGMLVRNSPPDTLAWVLELFPVLKERLRQRAGTLSGGQQQMVATARALCINPKILLLDEPSEGLMPSLVEKLLQTVVSLKTNRVGIILVEQKVDAVLRFADKVLFLENGAIQHQALPAQLREDPEPLARYVGVKR